MTITQVITALPAAPNPAADLPAVFNEKAAASVLAQMALPAEINTWATQANALEANVNAKESATHNDAIATAADRVQTGADREQTGWDRIAAAASAAVAAMAAAFSDANYFIRNAVDTTKRLRFDLAGFSTATTRVITVPNKNGTMAMLDDGGLVPVAEIVLGSSIANIDFLSVFSSAYDRYLISFEDLRTSSGAGDVNLRYAVGGSVDAAATYFDNLFGSSATGSDTGLFLCQCSSALNTGAFGEFICYDVNSTTNTHKRSSSVGLGNGSAGTWFHGFYFRATAAALSGFRLYLTSGVNFAAGGKVRVYGYKKA